MNPYFRLLQKAVQALLFVGLLLLGLPAQAATNYQFSPLDRALDVLPAGCTYYSSTAYTCANILDLADDDTITIASPLTITFAGVFTTGKRNLINSAGTFALTVATNAIFNLGEGSTLNANVMGTAAVNLEIGSTLVGNLTTTTSTGIVVLKANSRVLGGSITTDLGAVTLLDDVQLDGNISTEHGGAITVGNRSTVGGNIYTGIGDAAVTLLLNVQVKGGITTGAGTVTVGNGSTIDGAIQCIRAGIVALGDHVTVKSGIKTLAGGVTTGEYATIGSPGISTLAGGVTIWAYGVVAGGISTQAGIVTLWHDNTVKGSITTGAGGISIENLGAICGDIYSSTGVLVLTAGVKVGGSVSSGVGAITIGMTGNNISTVGGNVVGAAALTMTKVWVGGNVSALGAITLTDVRVGGSWTGTVTNNNSISNDTTLVIPPSTGCPSAVTSTVAGAFECLEKGLLAGAWTAETTTTNTTHRLYTKLAGTPFAFDVVALQSDGTVEANYVASGGLAKSVTLDLVDGSAAGCAGLPGLSGVASQAISFTGSELISGRTTGPALTVSNAYANLRCRVTDANQTPNVVSCSSDNFAVRPSSATLLTTATAVAPSASATPAFKAGTPFTLRATASPGYTGSLTLDTGKLTGGIVGALTPSALVANAGAVSATYSEVGYVYLAPGAYRDDTFTSVDSAAGDCITATVDGVNYLSDALVGTTGKYGCSIGNATAVSLGRFYPDHFALTASAFTPACGATFTYMGQPFALSATLEAQNVAGAKTQNFSGALAMARVEAQLANNGVALDSARLTGQGSPVWTLGAYPFVATDFARAAVPDGPFDNVSMGLQVSSTDTALDASTAPYLSNRDMAASDCTSDKAGTSDGTCTASRMVQNAKLRYGRIKLKNAYGSERQAIQIPMAFEYWSSTGWQNNLLDSCSGVSFASSNFALAFPQGTATKPNNLQACDTALSLQGSPSAYVLKLSAPGKAGWADIALDMGTTPPGTQCLAVAVTSPGVNALPVAMAWLQNADPTVNPSARATFGIFKSPLIYRRENY